MINGNINESLQSSYIQMVMKASLKFTVVDTDLKEDTDSGLLVISDKAVNEDTIDIQEKFTAEHAQAPQEKKQRKKSFWHKLFHNN